MLAQENKYTSMNLTHSSTSLIIVCKIINYRTIDILDLYSNIVSNFINPLEISDHIGAY